MTRPDVARALQRLGISEEIYNELFNDFLVMAREKASELEGAVAGANLPQAAKIAHSIKGSAANLGADTIADIARVIEGESAKGIVTTEIMENVKALALCLEAFSS
jgi:HPt (histidine-containing phosphotransfer) domain-containing protein